MKRFLLLLVICMMLVSIMPLMHSNVDASVTQKTYTSNADFDEGILSGVEHETVHDQLQLSEEHVVLPFIWVANSGESTVSKIDTDTGNELGRYRTGPLTGFGENPSRTTVDTNGDLWVGNRDSDTAVKIALHPTDRNGDGIISTSVDSNGNGIIDPGEVLSWGDDEAVLLRIDPVDTGPRALAVDAYNNVWIGGYGSNMGYYNGQTGVLLKTIFTGLYNYGALVDGNGTLWISARADGLIRIDNPNAGTSVNPTGTHTITVIPTGDGWVYGISIDSAGYIYTSGWSYNRLRKCDPSTSSWVYSVGITGGNLGRGVTVGLDGDIWMAHSGSNAVTRHDDSNGDLKATVSVGVTPTGVATDTAGKIWVTNYGSNDVMRIDPATNTVDFTQSNHPNPYNYSDMTGIISQNITTKTGIWTVDFDSETSGTPWGAISWSSSEPTGTSVTVRARSSANKVDWSGWETATIGGMLSSTPDGRYLQIETTLRLGSGDVSPVLFDLTVDARQQLQGIPDQCIFSGEAFDTFDLDDYVTHPGAADHYEYHNSSNLTITIDSGNVVTITYPTSWTGTETIEFTVHDTAGGSAIDSDEVEFTVCPIPVVDGIPNQTAPFDTFDLDDYISGVEPEDVTWVASCDSSDWTVEIDPENVVTITPHEEALDFCNITFTATVQCCDREASDSATATFGLWHCIFEDPWRDTKLFVNTENETFRFTAMNGVYDTNIVHATRMTVRNGRASLRHSDHDLQLNCLFNCSTNLCWSATIFDRHTGQRFFIYDPAGIE